MKTISTFLCVLVTIIFCDAQLPLHSWSYSWGSAEYDVTTVLAVDAGANVYVAGYFKGTVDFDPGPGSATFTTGLGGFINETYVCKYDSSGHFLWVKHIATDVECITRAIVYDPTGFIYFSGYYEGQGDFDPGAGTHTMTSSNGSDDNFIVKLDLDGNFVWSTSIGGSGDDYGKNIALDEDGNILIAGSFKGTCDFDPGPNQFIRTSTAQLSDLFVAQYTSEGDFIWAQVILGSFQGDIFGLGTDHQANVFITGVFDDRRDFDPGPDSLIKVSTGFWDLFVMKLDHAGNYQWMHHLGNNNEAWGLDLAMDDEDHVLVTGFFSDSLDFDPGVETHLLTAILDDGFVWKLDNDGNLIWVAQLGGVSFDQGRAITIDKEANVYTSGFYAETIDFDPGPGEYNLTSTGNNDTDDAFISKLNKNGEFEWAYNLGGIQNDFSGEARLDTSGNVYITGSFQGKGGFYPGGTAPDSLSSNGSFDIFLTRWRQCLETSGEISFFSCQSYTSPSGKYIWNESGTYLDTIKNIAGCDSIITILLTIIEQELSILQQGNQLSAQGDAEIYYWVDCNNGFSVIPDATGPEFTPESSGLYAVVGESFQCSDTSACFQYTTTATNESTRYTGIHIYPNPAHDVFFVDLLHLHLNSSIKMIDATGRTVYTKDFNNEKLLEIVHRLTPGLYILEIQLDQKQQWYKLVIE